MEMSASVKALKSALRKQMKTKLRGVGLDAIEQQSVAVTAKLLATPEYQSSRRVALFLSMSGEVNTTHILRHLFESGRQCFVPMCTPTTMDMVRLQSWDDFVSLPKNSWGIPEPRPEDGRENALDASGSGLDLIVMPGLAFDAQGHRMGYGKGYYDKFLARCQADTTARGLKRPATVALGLQEMLVESVPTDHFDMQPDAVLLPDRTVRPTM
ncbi:5-formyltetrahydrofolate cyclo-ligase [Entophlyctis helioformis]|nr:5-formyltetrahydrofolate cyclo-ligase [Entophlyctis helioformis]